MVRKTKKQKEAEELKQLIIDGKAYQALKIKQQKYREDNKEEFNIKQNEKRANMTKKQKAREAKANREKHRLRRMNMTEEDKENNRIKIREKYANRTKEEIAKTALVHKITRTTRSKKQIAKDKAYAIEYRIKNKDKLDAYKKEWTKKKKLCI